MLGWLLIVWRFVTIFSWLGGPLYTFDLVKNGDKDLPMIVICSVPISLMVLGSTGFNFERARRFLVRVGVFGSVSLLMMNAFATISYLFYWPGYRDQWLVVSGLVAGFVCAVSYILLARSYLSRPR